jgi:hypothetical protein
MTHLTHLTYLTHLTHLAYLTYLTDLTLEPLAPENIQKTPKRLLTSACNPLSLRPQICFGRFSPILSGCPLGKTD